MRSNHAHIPLLCMALSTVAVVIFLYSYIYNGINTSLANVELAKNAKELANSNSSIVQTSATIYDSTKDKRAGLRALFIPSDNVVSFIESLEAMDNKSGGKVIISGVTADDTNSLAEGAFANIKAHVETTGSWNEIMDTLMIAENLPYDSSIEGVRMAESDEVDAKITKKVWHLSFDVKAVLLVGKATKTNEIPIQK